MKNMSKKKATEFYKSFIGTAKGLQIGDCSWNIDTGGQMRYAAWIVDNRIYLQCFLDGYCINAMYFNLDTYEYEYDYMDKLRDDELHDDIMENAEYWQGQIDQYLNADQTK